MRASLVGILGRFVNKDGVMATPPLLKCLVQVVAEIEYADLTQAKLGALEV